jgi:ABC-type Zn uptake system ZnuABC Zn-binding protein ZnuA
MYDGWLACRTWERVMMLSGLRWLTLAVLLGALLVSCGDETSDARDSTGADGAITVVATTTQIADLARAVAGDRATVDSLLPPNADAHDFEPAPQDIEAVADAGLVLENGIGLDEWVTDLVDESGTDAPTVTVTDGIALRAADSGDHEEDDHDRDPHVWLDVANAKIMVARIRDALIEVDPDGGATYEANAIAYLGTLDELDAWIREQIGMIPEENRKLVTNHDALGYFIAAYGLTFVGAIIPSLESQAQPTARETDELIDRIEVEGVKAIFTEASINPDLARQLADEAHVEVVDDLYVDSLGPPDSGADTYIGMMRSNTTKIVEALR